MDISSRTGLPETLQCSDCTNQAFIPVSGQLIVEHLQGRHVMGVYPLLEDESCWFLAVDFDKHAWQEDVAAFAETCRSARMSLAIVSDGPERLFDHVR